MEEIIVPVALFSITPVIVWIVSAYRTRAHQASMGLLEAVANKGEPITPELVRTLGVRRRPAHADLRTGVILVASAVATIGLGWALDDGDTARILAGIAAFPGLIGIVLIALWTFIGRKSDD